MKCKKSGNDHICFAPSVGWTTPCVWCTTPAEAQKFINESEGQKLPKSCQEIEERRDKYDAGLRIKEIETSIINLQRDGLKVGLKDGKLYVENTTYTDNHDDDSTFGYAEIDCFAD